MRVATLLAFFSLSFAIIPAGAQAPVVEVYKSPTCGCCVKWVAHLQQHGLTVRTTDVPDPSVIKMKVGVPGRLSSCHTALVDGYVVEGHVPAVDVLRLLKERPRVTGLAVPGMPEGSPGMEGPNPDAYDVFAFDPNGNVTMFASHGP